MNKQWSKWLNLSIVWKVCALCTNTLNYFINSRQYVQIGRSKNFFGTVEYGLPQGSGLGVVSISIYLNNGVIWLWLANCICLCENTVKAIFWLRV